MDHIVQTSYDHGRSWEDIAKFKYHIEAQAYSSRHYGDGGLPTRLKPAGQPQPPEPIFEGL